MLAGCGDEDGSARDAALIEARTLFAAGDFRAALERYERAAARARPGATRARALQGAARMALELGRYDAAQQSLAAARAESPGDAPNATLLEAEALHAWYVADYARGESLATQAVRRALEDPGEPGPYARARFTEALLVDFAGRPGEGIRRYRTALAAANELPREDPLAGRVHVRLAAALAAAGRFDEGRSHADSALAHFAQVLGPEHPYLGLAHNAIGYVESGRGRPTEAEAAYQRGLSILERRLGPVHLEVGTSLYGLAGVYLEQRRYREAEAVARRLLEIDEALNDPVHPDVALSLVQLAEVHRQLGRYADARPLLQRAVAIDERVNGPNHPALASTLESLAQLYRDEGRYEAAEGPARRALAIRLAALGPDHPDVASSLLDVADLADDLGDPAIAERLLERAIGIYERIHGPDHDHVGSALGRLLRLYLDRGIGGEQLGALFKRIVALRMRQLGAALGASEEELAPVLAGIAALELAGDAGAGLASRMAAGNETQRRAAGEAMLSLLEDLRPIIDFAIGAHEHLLPELVANLATMASNAVDATRAVYPDDHPAVAGWLYTLGRMRAALGREEEAEALLQQSLDARRRTLGDDHPSVAYSHHRLAELQRRRGALGDALEHARRASATLARRIARAERSESARGRVERGRHGDVFTHQVQVLSALQGTDAEGGTETEPTRAAESFRAAQLASAQRAADALASTAARFASGDDALAGLVRRRQDLAGQWREADRELASAAAARPRDRSREQRLRTELTTARDELARIDDRLEREFPRYRELSSPAPVEPGEARALLDAGEALVAYLIGSEDSFAWVVSEAGLAFVPLGITRDALSRQVQSLRRALDPERASGRRFDAERAHALYRVLLAPLVTHLGDARHLLLVPDGPLQSLPFGVLVEQPPDGETRGPASLRSLAWVAKRFALTVLPSVSSLRALRRFAGPSAATEPFTGFGDPRLGGTRAPTARGLAGIYTRGGQVDVAQIRALPDLPDSADELRRIAAALGAPSSALHLGAAASEATVASTDLRAFRTVAFATHALTAGEFGGLAEPALVLTPPAQPSGEDDGLLTAGEIARLALDADWVVLSACNTAAPDGTPGAEGLSGLARAFFYAGTRTLLVSHWAVSSEAAVSITTGLFAALAADPGLSRAEALRRSELALLEDAERPHLAHPAFWAPFVVVGEGGRGPARLTD